MSDTAFVLSKYTQKYLGEKGHGVRNLFLNSS